MSAVEKCKTIWTVAKSDTEKFAALMVIAKVLQRDKVTQEEQQEIFNIIGFKFLCRLCQTESDDSASEFSPYKILAIAILSNFSRDRVLMNDPQISYFIPSLLEALSLGESTEVTWDALMIVVGLIQSKNVDMQKQLIDGGAISICIKMYKKSQDAKILVVIGQLLLKIDDPHPDTEEFVNILAKEFAEDQTLKKFYLCFHLMTMLAKHICILNAEIGILIRKGLTDILQSKLRKKERDVALKLASMLMLKYGVTWFTDDQENSKLFFMLLVQVTSVEICMILDEHDIAAIQKDMFLLTACYTIMEQMIGVLVNTESFYDENLEYVPPLCNSINMAFKSVISFIKLLAEDSESDGPILKSREMQDICLESIRAFCWWLSEETHANHKEMLEILPFIMSICNKAVFQSYGTGICKKVLSFLIPPLCHLVSEDGARKILLEHGLLPLLFKHVKEELEAFEKREFADESSMQLASMCHVFITIVVLDSKISAETEDFFVFLRLLFDTVPQLGNKASTLPLKACSAVLGLLVTKLFYKSVNTCETKFYGFLSSSVRFLWDAHVVEDINGPASFCISREYREVWEEIVELWFLGMEALSRLLPLMPWICGYLVESGWPQHIISAFDRVGERGLEGSNKSTYQAFLCELVKVDDKAASTLIDCNGLDVCAKHKMNELGSILLKHRVLTALHLEHST